MLRDQPHAAHELLGSALAAGTQPQWLMAEILWPAAECLAQLRRDRLISLRAFNQAAHAVTRIAGHLDAAIAPAPSRQRRLLVVSAPGEPGDLGANLFSLLADACGFTALFAGAGLQRTDIAFAIAHLEPDALIIHGSLPSSLPATQRLITDLQASSLWPQIQIACLGAMVGTEGRITNAGDISSHHPLELLELLALCPDHRALPGITPPDLNAPANTLQFPAGTTPTLHVQAIDDLLRQLFPPRLHIN